MRCHDYHFAHDRVKAPVVPFSSGRKFVFPHLRVSVPLWFICVRLRHLRVKGNTPDVVSYRGRVGHGHMGRNPANRFLPNSTHKKTAKIF